MVLMSKARQWTCHACGKFSGKGERDKRELDSVWCWCQRPGNGHIMHVAGWKERQKGAGQCMVLMSKARQWTCHGAHVKGQSKNTFCILRGGRLSGKRERQKGAGQHMVLMSKRQMGAEQRMVLMSKASQKTLFAWHRGDWTMYDACRLWCCENPVLAVWSFMCTILSCRLVFSFDLIEASDIGIFCLTGPCKWMWCEDGDSYHSSEVTVPFHLIISDDTCIIMYLWALSTEIQFGCQHMVKLWLIGPCKLSFHLHVRSYVQV